MASRESVYATKFELRPGRECWLIVRRDGETLKRVDTPSDWLVEQCVAWAAVNTLKTRANALVLWWRWCGASSVDPMKATATEFSGFLLALQSVPKDHALTSVVRALPGDQRLRAASTVAQTANHVKAFYVWAWKNGKVSVITGQQIANFKTPRAVVQKRADRLQPEQVSVLFSQPLTPRDRLALELLYAAGLREGEALGLRVQDMHVNTIIAEVFDCRLRIGPHLHVVRRPNSNGAVAKSHYERVVPISTRLLAAYRDWQNYLYGLFRIEGVVLVRGDRRVLAV